LLPFRDPERYLRDILESIQQINEFIGDMDLTAYQRDEKTRAAVERKMQILTEAVTRLEKEGPEAYPEIDWKGYRGMGNFLRHSYHRVSDEIVWNTVKDDLPLLRRIVEKALETLQSNAARRQGFGLAVTARLVPRHIRS
jgi:uncharacterized protein with HEPN domain